MDLLPFYPGPIGVPPFSPNAPCNRSHLFFLAPALDSEIRCFHHTSLPPTVQLLSDILVSEPNSLPSLARKIIVRRHSSERYGSIAIAIRPSSIELREMKIMGKKKKKLKTVSLTVLILWIQERGEGIGRKSKGRVKTSSPRSLFKYSKQLPTTMRCYHLENGGENAGEIRGRGEKGRKQGA